MAKKLIDLCEIREFKKGDTILHQGDKVDGMYIIRSGNVTVERDDESIAPLGEGDYFGEIGLLLHERRSATITAASDAVSVYFLPKNVFEEFKDELGEEVIDEALRRFSKIYEKNI